MSASRPVPFQPGLLRPTADLRRLGEDPEEVVAGSRRWTRVRHGVVVRASTWSGLTPEQRHAAFVHATSMQMRGDTPAPFSHSSAAALWGLPRVSAWPVVAHVSETGRGVRSSGLIRRHVAEVAAVAHVQGLAVTTLARTVVDLACVEELHDAVAAADHALHHRLCTRADLELELQRLAPGARGRTRATLAVTLADAGAMSVGESLSRVQMFRLNLPRPRLQVPIEDDDGLVGYGDFGWEGVVGEFDGRRKYGVLPDATSEQVTEVLWREKRREDRIRARGLRMARWVWADAMAPIRMARILAEQGVRRERRNGWFAA